MPWTGACFIAGSAAICALPPLNGFAGEWLLYQAFLRLATVGPSPASRLVGLLLVGWLALVGALALACFVKAYGVAFARAAAQRREPGTASEVDGFSVSAMVIVAMCFAAEILPGPIVDFLQPVVQGFAGARLPEQTFMPWASIVPVASSRSSYQWTADPALSSSRPAC